MLEKSASNIRHPEYTKWLIKKKIADKIISGFLPMDCNSEFLQFYPDWIESSKNNAFVGCKTFPNRYVSVGVTQAIDDWTLFCLKNNLRLRIFRGEYPYSKEFNNWCWIEDEPLTVGDAVLISFPFSGSGNKHPQYDWLINICNNLQLPVFVDCAFFGACSDLEVNVNQPCIDTVAFSLTKGLATNDYRSGIVFSKRHKQDTTLDVQNIWQNSVHLNVAMGLQLMKQFGPDTLVEVYKEKQISVCKSLGLEPSNTIHLATGDEKWNDYSRDGVYNRVNIRNMLGQQNLYSMPKNDHNP